MVERVFQQPARVGDRPAGEEAGQFLAPHGIAVDSLGDIYLAEVSWSAYDSRLDSPRQVRTLQKPVLVRNTPGVSQLATED